MYYYFLMKFERFMYYFVITCMFMHIVGVPSYIEVSSAHDKWADPLTPSTPQRAL